MHPFLQLDFKFGTVFLYNREQYHRWGIGELDLALIHTAVGIRYWSKKSVRYSKLAGSLKIYGAVNKKKKVAGVSYKTDSYSPPSHSATECTMYMRLLGILSHTHNDIILNKFEPVIVQSIMNPFLYFKKIRSYFLKSCIVRVGPRKKGFRADFSPRTCFLRPKTIF